MYAETLQGLTLDEDVKNGYVHECIGSTILLLRLAMRKPSTSVTGGPIAHETLF